MASGAELNNSLNTNQISSQGKNFTSAASSKSGFDWGSISDTVVSKFGEVVEAAIVLFITFLVIRWVKRYIARVEIGHEQQRTALNVVEKLLVGFVTVIGITIALKIVGIDMSVLVGVGLLGLSYALKDIIQNYVAGILIFLKAPFKIGDVVKIKHYIGKVDKMEFQSTSLKTFDQRDITIYNSDIMSQSIENYSRNNIRRLEIDVNLGYGSDIHKITTIIGKILENHASVLKSPKNSITFKCFKDNSMVIRIKFWVPVPSNFLSIRSEIAWQINQAFDESTVFGPYQKSFQSTTDFTLNTERQNRIKEFYSNPLFTTPAPAAEAAAASGTTPEIAINDIDEPSDAEEGF